MICLSFSRCKVKKKQALANNQSACQLTFNDKGFLMCRRRLFYLQNPSDSVSQEVKAAEGLFYEEGAFKIIVYCGVAILGVLIIAGLVYEFLAKKYLQRK